MSPWEVKGAVSEGEPSGWNLNQGEEPFMRYYGGSSMGKGISQLQGFEVKVCVPESEGSPVGYGGMSIGEGTGKEEREAVSARL